MTCLIEGEWSAHEGGYALKLGDMFLGKVRQKGGNSIYSKCWIASLNNIKYEEVNADPDYARGLVERWICDELQRIVPAYKLIKGRVPPSDCFWGQDAGSRWLNWKEEKAVEGWVFQKPTLRQLHAALKKSGQL